MPLYDIFCEKCNKIEEDVWLKINEDIPNCPVCNEVRERVCNCRSFRLKYNPKVDTVGWSWDGYASSMYWSEVRKQRAEGKKVKGFGEE